MLAEPKKTTPVNANSTKRYSRRRENDKLVAPVRLCLPLHILPSFSLLPPPPTLCLALPCLTTACLSSPHSLHHLPTTVSALFNKLSFPDSAKAQILLCSLPCAIRLLVLVPCYVQVQVALGPRAELLTGRPPHWASRGRRLNALTPTPNNHHTHGLRPLFFRL